MDSDDVGRSIIYGILGLLVLFLLSLGGYSIVQSIRSDGEIKYCFVQLQSPQGMPPVYQLYGFRPWCPDRHIGTYQTLDQAVEAAGKVQCNLKQVPKF